MQRLGLFAVLLAVVVTLAGCSEGTQEKASKALNQTGQAIKSAAKDASAVTKGAIEGAKEAVEKNRAESSAEPAK
jgi:hypothetical protein